MNQRFDQLATIQFVVVVGVVHFEVVELQLLLRHFARIDVGHLHMLGNVVALTLQIARVQHAALMSTVVPVMMAAGLLMVGGWLLMVLLLLLMVLWLLLMMLRRRWLMALKRYRLIRSIQTI
jgi:hypothetical protein